MGSQGSGSVIAFRQLAVPPEMGMAVITMAEAVENTTVASYTQF